VSAHNAIARTWICTGCGEPWPCATRRRQLLAQYADAEVSLSLLLAAAMIEAAGEPGGVLRDVPAGDLYARFIGWLRATDDHETER
jgi:hypothetical protein